MADRTRRESGTPISAEATRKHVSTPGIALAWAPFQARTSALARALGAQAAFVTSRLPRHPAFLPFRYLACTRRTWRLLRRRRPEFVLAVTPPVLVPLLAWSWCRLRGAALVVDCHTDTFHAPKWAWAQPFLRRLFARSRAVLVHTEEAEAIVRSWNVPVMLLPDDVPDVTEAEECARRASPTVLVAGSLDENEPVAEAIEAACALSECEWRFTGDFSTLPERVRSKAPENVVFTGYLPYPRFLGEMLAADVVAVFSTDPHIMNRAAFEAAGLGRPLILSDLVGLHRRFGEGALYSTNEPRVMAATVRTAMEELGPLGERSHDLGERLRSQRERALGDLRRRLFGGRDAGRGSQGAGTVSNPRERGQPAR